MSETAPTEQEQHSLSAEIENRDRQLDLCTIYNEQAEGAKRREQWITAKEGSFIDRARME